jgi:hypothetical protein
MAPSTEHHVSAYLTPIGYFSGLKPGLDVRWSIYIFPYKFDAVVGGNQQTPKDTLVGCAQTIDFKSMAIVYVVCNSTHDRSHSLPERSKDPVYDSDNASLNLPRSFALRRH